MISKILFLPFTIVLSCILAVLLCAAIAALPIGTIVGAAWMLWSQAVAVMVFKILVTIASPIVGIVAFATTVTIMQDVFE